MDCKTSHDYCIRKLVIIPVNYDDLIIHCSFITMSKDDIVAYIYIQIYWYVLYVYDYINILIPHHYESPCRMRKIRDLEIQPLYLDRRRIVSMLFSPQSKDHLLQLKVCGNTFVWPVRAQNKTHSALDSKMLIELWIFWRLGLANTDTHNLNRSYQWFLFHSNECL